MFCRKTSCAVAAMLLTATIFINLGFVMKPKASLSQTFRDSAAMERIVEERRRLAVEGLILGLVVAYVLASAMGLKHNSKNRKSTACFVAAVTLVVQYFFYSLMPKSDWALLHMETPDEVRAWLDVYKQHKQSYHAGALVGLLGAAAMGASM